MKKNYCKIKEPLSQRKYRRNPFKDVNGLRSNKMSLNSGKEKKNEDEKKDGKKKNRTYYIHQKNLYDRQQPPIKFHRCNILSETESKTRKEKEN